jgi:RNA polymerase sigma-70 factor, ECF subfamily
MVQIGKSMIAIIEKMDVRFEVRVAEKPRDPSLGINSPAFLKALRDGSPASKRAFRDLVLHMRAPLIRFIGRWFRETESIEDVFQETFLAVHLSLPRFEGKSRLTTWVYSLAQHKIMDRLSEKYRPGRGGAQVCAQTCEVEAPDLRPDEAAHQSLLIARIRSVAEALPELYREAWRLRDMEAMSGEEAAEALGITPTLVRVRLHRARCLIVDRLRKERPGLFGELQAGVFAGGQTGPGALSRTPAR